MFFLNLTYRKKWLFILFFIISDFYLYAISQTHKENFYRSINCDVIDAMLHIMLFWQKFKRCNKSEKPGKYRCFPYLLGFLKVDLAGIEPASESLSLAASPITVADLTFPWRHAHRQAYRFSSFMIHLPGQSLPGKVSHIVGARFLMCECIRADEQRLGC